MPNEVANAREEIVQAAKRWWLRHVGRMWNEPTADSLQAAVKRLKEAESLHPQQGGEIQEVIERNKLLEQIVDGFVDSLDGEPSGGDNLDFLLHQYGYRPTKGVPG